MTGITNPSLYTNRADPDLVAKIARITGNTDSFATDFMGNLESGDDPHCVRLLALYDRPSGTWGIIRQTRVTNEAEGITHNDTEISGKLCFFDTLHYLARFQTTETELGKQPVQVTGKSFSGTQHYTETAKESGQATDINGEIHPCVGGHILTKGFFTDAAVEIAATTKERHMVVEHKPYDQFLQSLKPDRPSSELVMAKMARAELESLGKILSSGNGLHSAFAVAAQRKFKPPAFEYIGVGMMSFGLSAFALHLQERSNPGEKAALNAYSCLGGMKYTVEKMPDVPAKPVLQEFNRTAEYALYIERAAYHYDSCHRKKKAEKALGRGLFLIDRAATVASLGPAEREQLRADYMAGKLEKDVLRNNLRKIWGSYPYGDSQIERRLNRQAASGEDKKTLTYQIITRIEDLYSLNLP